MAYTWLSSTLVDYSHSYHLKNIYAVAEKTKNNALMNPVIVSSCFFTLSITAGIVVKASAIYTIANTVVTIFDSFLFFEFGGSFCFLGIWRT